MNNHPNDRFDELMRRTLAEEADRIEPADGLPEIQARVRDQHKPVTRRPWALTAGAAVVGTAAAIGAFLVLNDNTRNADDPSVAGPAGTSTSATTGPGTKLPTAAATAAPSPEPSQVTDPPSPRPNTSATAEPEVQSGSVPVYWLGKTVGFKSGSGFRLYRTFSKVSGRPAVEAVQLMTTTTKPTDPDYQSPWQGAVVGSVTRADGLVTVDFESLPRTDLEPAIATVAAQQLVYTVQGALKTTEPVQVTERGQSTGKLFGVDIAQPLRRAKAADVQAFIWVDSPANGATVSAPFKVSGTAAVYEAQLNWRVVAAGTRKMLAQGTARTTEAFKPTPYSFTVTKLPTGTYTLEVFEASAEDGRDTSTDTKTIVVR